MLRTTSPKAYIMFCSLKPYRTAAALLEGLINLMY